MVRNTKIKLNRYSSILLEKNTERLRRIVARDKLKSKQEADLLKTRTRRNKSILNSLIVILKPYSIYSPLVRHLLSLYIASINGVYQI